VAEAGRADTAIGPVPLAAELRGDVDVLLRPEQLRVSAGREAIIDAVEYFGHDAVYLTRLPGGDALRVRVLDAPEFRPGDTVDLDYVGGPTVGYPRARERRARTPDAHAEGSGEVQRR
jgi:iron(III) transport system ATP-binding protein